MVLSDHFREGKGNTIKRNDRCRLCDRVWIMHTLKEKKDCKWVITEMEKNSVRTVDGSLYEGGNEQAGGGAYVLDLSQPSGTG
jgi:hypothetical protein